jgi:hypothetical protein
MGTRPPDHLNLRWADRGSLDLDPTTRPHVDDLIPAGAIGLAKPVGWGA